MRFKRSYEHEIFRSDLRSSDASFVWNVDERVICDAQLKKENYFNWANSCVLK